MQKLQAPGTIVMSEGSLGNQSSEDKCINGSSVVFDDSWEPSLLTELFTTIFKSTDLLVWSVPIYYYRFLVLWMYLLCVRLPIRSNAKNIGKDNAELKYLVYYLESNLFCFAIQTVPIVFLTRKSPTCPR